MHNMLKKAATVLGFAAAIASGAASANWVDGINWSIGNSTGPDQLNCPEQYVATEPRAAFEGGRAALMRRAIESAKAGNYPYAFRLALITQCHNAAAQAELAAAGQKAVGDYLRTK